MISMLKMNKLLKKMESMLMNIVKMINLSEMYKKQLSKVKFKCNKQAIAQKTLICQEILIFKKVRINSKIQEYKLIKMNKIWVLKHKVRP